jgi:hypothetical protein
MCSELGTSQKWLSIVDCMELQHEKNEKKENVYQSLSGERERKKIAKKITASISVGRLNYRKSPTRGSNPQP